MSSKLRNFLKSIPLIYQIGRAINRHKWEKEIQKRRLLLQDKGLAVARLVQESLKDSGFNFFVTYGSLLGLVRSGSFMKHDSDLDFGLLIKSNKDFFKLSQILIQKGFEFERFFHLDGRVIEMTLVYEGLPVDFFAYFDEEFEGEKISLVYSCRRSAKSYPDDISYSVIYYPMPRIEGIAKRNFGRYIFNVPLNAEKYLADYYGENFMIPDKGWSEKCCKYYFELDSKYAKLSKDLRN